eukprot:4052994-Karenia_brevis.AAC.1
MEASVEFSPALLEVEEAVEVLDAHDQKDLKSFKDNAQERLTAHDEFMKQFIAKRKAINAAAGGGAGKGLGKGSVSIT